MGISQKPAQRDVQKYMGISAKARPARDMNEYVRAHLNSGAVTESVQQGAPLQRRLRVNYHTQYGLPNDDGKSHIAGQSEFSRRCRACAAQKRQRALCGTFFP